jgi:O-methyltransferase involved in polyketide biosynthesis
LRRAPGNWLPRLLLRRIGIVRGRRPAAYAPRSGREKALPERRVPNIARVYDYWLGGKDNYAVDRAVAEAIIAVFPDIQVTARAQRAFLTRAVHYLAAEAGIRQFLDIGTGLPSASNTHEVAQQVAPRSRVVYVDNDPVVLAYARALLATGPGGATSYVEADLRDTGRLLAEAGRSLDFGEPVAILLLGVLPFIPDEDNPVAIVSRLLAGVPSGSYLAVAHPASDVAGDQVARSVQRYNARARDPITVRSHAAVCRFFDGLDLVEPGVVQLHRWQPIGTEGVDDSRELPDYGAVGRKP